MSVSNVKILQDIANQIKEENLRGRERIPTSETFIKRMMTLHSKSAEDIKFFLEQLKELHYIFVITVVASDPTLFVQGVDAYVYAELSILNELKHYTEQRLTQVYESTYYKRKSGFQIIRELLPKIKEFNNTQLGRNLNEAIMLDEYSRLITTSPFEYTDSWRKEKLYKLYREEEPNYEVEYEVEGNSPYPQSTDRRVQDSGNSKWAKAVNQFSIRFLIRIHFRKYEFDVVKRLVLTSKISMLDDLIYIRNTLKDLEKQLDKDTILKYHLDKIIELRRITQAKINNLRKIQQSAAGSV
ncbi:MAG TPA: hypothetical protein PK079_13840 [Leptospiraceae bacterium]|nr:hypothetical protein [Leptospiraceae bacterium]HMX35091.1 hypothetical protein [Leptospiraceae bacterium]HMY33145.1 hypothetical protein [Leptospiraceae bacterium]HMZ66027.1 hypothetical protein [Leptospiraceae bacterium]HNA09350.1 hypothetical protein [Leptospiraceae bacterium]